MKGTLRAGDTVIIKELDRMGRNMEQIKREWQELQQMGVSIIVTDTPLLNTANKTDLEKQLITNIVFELLAYMAEKERQKIHARQAEGIAIAKQQGKYKGRKPIERADFPQVYKAWKAGEITAVAAMERLQLSNERKRLFDSARYCTRTGLDGAHCAAAVQYRQTARQKSCREIHHYPRSTQRVYQ